MYLSIFTLVRRLPEPNPPGIDQQTVHADVDPLQEHGYQGHHEQYEVAVVEASDTVVGPDTVMVKSVYTSVAGT